MSSTQLQEGAWPTFLHPKLCNTRALESFRNQVTPLACVRTLFGKRSKLLQATTSYSSM